MDKTNGSLLIGFDFTHEGVLIVGQKKAGQNVEIINAFDGDEAKDLYQRLITRKKPSTDE